MYYGDNIEDDLDGLYQNLEDLSADISAGLDELSDNLDTFSAKIQTSLDELDQNLEQLSRDIQLVITQLLHNTHQILNAEIVDENKLRKLLAEISSLLEKNLAKANQLEQQARQLLDDYKKLPNLTEEQKQIIARLENDLNKANQLKMILKENLRKVQNPTSWVPNESGSVFSGLSQHSAGLSQNILREPVMMSAVTSVSEQPALLSDLSASNVMLNGDQSQQNAVSAQQALNQLALTTSAKAVQRVSNLAPMEAF